MSEETLKIVVPVFTAVLGLFVGYFLNQALYQRKRKDELADRDFNRRVAIHDTRINEARDYVDSWDLITKLYQRIFRILKNESNIEAAEKK